MSLRRLPISTLLCLLLLMTGGCAVYDKYGYGIVVKSRMAPGQATPVSLPPEAPTISQRYLPDDPPSIPGHKGFDMLVPYRTPVIAAAEGVVARVSTSLLYGRQILLDHARGDAGYRIQTRYFHLTEQVVGAGEPVRRGQLLGYSGATGMAGVYPHLHFEVHRLDEGEPAAAAGYLDPQLFWVDGVGRVTCYDAARDFDPEPVRLTYPVPCRGIDAQ